MNIILFGPPGSGKGTQSRLISDKYKLKLISLGDILRNYHLKDINIKKKIFLGKLISDNIIIKIVKNFIISNFCKYGYLFDGFPRNIIQAKSLDFLNIDYVIELYVYDKLLFKRLFGRRVHINSGRIYHLLYNPPKKYGLDDITGEKLSFRKDDINISVVKKRISIYYYELIYLRCFYKNKFKNYTKKSYYIINANKNINDVTNNIFLILND